MANYYEVAASTFEGWPVLHLHRNNFPLVIEKMQLKGGSVKIARNRQRMFIMNRKFKPKNIPVTRSPEIQEAATQVLTHVLVDGLT